MNEKRYDGGDVILYRRENSSYWQAKVRVANDPSLWKRFSTKETAQKKALVVARRKQAIFQYAFGQDQPITNARFLVLARIIRDDLESKLRSNTAKPSTESYYIAANKYLVPFLEDKHKSLYITNVNHSIFNEYYGYVEDKLGHRPAASTLNKHNVVIRDVFELATEKKYISRRDIPNLSCDYGVDSTRRPAFTKDEWQIIYSYLEEWCNKGRKARTKEIRRLVKEIAIVLVSTGLRPMSEVNKLKWFHISEIVKNDDLYLNLQIPKAKTRGRTISTDITLKNCFERIALLTPELNNIYWDDLIKKDRYIFRLPDERKIVNIHEVFRALLKDVDLLTDKQGNRRTLYSLRHSYITWKIMDGVDVNHVAAHCGTSPEMIRRYYNHLESYMVADKISGLNYQDVLDGENTLNTKKISEKWFGGAKITKIELGRTNTGAYNLRVKTEDGKVIGMVLSTEQEKKECFKYMLGLEQ